MLLVRWLLSALALLLTAYIIPTITIDGIYAALIVALVLGLVNALIRPVLVILTLPLTILTLGLFTLVINGFLFWLVSTFIKGFEVADFWAAFWGALVYSLLTGLISWMAQKASN